MQSRAGSRSGRGEGGRPCVLRRDESGILCWKQEEVGEFCDTMEKNQTRGQGNELVLHSHNQSKK